MYLNMPKAVTYNRAITCFNSDLSCPEKTPHGTEDANTQLQYGYSQQRAVLTQDILSKSKKLRQRPWYTESTWCASSICYKQITATLCSIGFKDAVTRNKNHSHYIHKSTTQKGIVEISKHCCWSKLVCRVSLEIRA